MFILATIIPILANFFYVFNATAGLNILPKGYDLTPVSFSTVPSTVFRSIVQIQILNIVPIAYRKIVSNLSESIIVVDSFNKIDNYNESF